MKFSDKVVFVTGAAQGMGLAIVQRFAAEGAAWWPPTSTPRPPPAAVAELGERGLAVGCNVADSASVVAVSRPSRPASGASGTW